MKKICFWGWTVLFFLITAGPTDSPAGESSEMIRETTDKIIAIVSDAALKTPEKEMERKRLIRQAVDERFDWPEMTRRSLARHWAKRTEEEKIEFIDLFGQLLERTYLERVEGYSGEKVVYEGDITDGDYAVVKVKIINRQDTEIPVRYKLKKKENGWFVYDISIEGVSLVNNYRTQFNSVIARSSYEKLVQKLKVKIEEE